MEEQLDYDAEQISVERARRIAEILRKQSGQTPQGRMVGRFYVASDPFQHLAGLASAAMANYKEKQADEKQGDIARRQSAEFERTLGEVPQRRVLTRSIPAPDISGGAPSNVGAMPVNPQNVNAQSGMSAVEEKQVVNPTRQDMLQWAGKMYRLPMARQLATKMMADYTGQAKNVPLGHIGSLDQDTGEMTGFGPGLEIEKAKLAQQAIDLSLRLQDKQLDRDMRERLGNQLRETQILLGQMRQPDANLTAARIGALEAEARWKDKRTDTAGGSSTKPAPKYVDDKFSGMVDTIGTLERQIKSFKDDFANTGLLGGTKRKLASVMGSMGTESMQENDAWWRAQDRQDELLERYKLFGATLTSNELKSWQNATIRPGLSSAKILEFLQVRQNILKNKLNEELTKYKRDNKYEMEGTEGMLRDRGYLREAPPNNDGGIPTSRGPRDLSGAKVIKR
jgi:hypothetical protein